MGNYFEKVSKEQFEMDSNYGYYGEVEIPIRATKGSAGYDIVSPEAFTLLPNESVVISTGLRVHLDEDKVLMIFPRSSLGFKYKMVLNNTVGIIDSDYYNAENEGHIKLKITNEGQSLMEVNVGERIAQGIIVQFFKTEEDNANGFRKGGMGSTGK